MALGDEDEKGVTVRSGRKYRGRRHVSSHQGRPEPPEEGGSDTVNDGQGEGLGSGCDEPLSGGFRYSTTIN